MLKETIVLTDITVQLAMYVEGKLKQNFDSNGILFIDEDPQENYNLINVFYIKSLHIIIIYLFVRGHILLDYVQFFKV